MSVHDIIIASCTLPLHLPLFILLSLDHRREKSFCQGFGSENRMPCQAGSTSHRKSILLLQQGRQLSRTQSSLLMNSLADDDLIALPFENYVASITTTSKGEMKSTNHSIQSNKGECTMMQLRLCVIRNQNYVYPLLQHEDDVETDLYLDPRHLEREIRYSDVLDWLVENTNNVVIAKEEVLRVSQQYYYGVGWYGQRPVPSLGGGPGYGAEATEVWSIDYETLERLKEDGVNIPMIDVGIAHGEKARGGALF